MRVAAAPDPIDRLSPVAEADAARAVEGWRAPHRLRRSLAACRFALARPFVALAQRRAMRRACFAPRRSSTVPTSTTPVLRDPPPWVDGMAFSSLQFAWEDATLVQRLGWLDDAGPPDDARRTVVALLAERLESSFLGPFLRHARAGIALARPFREAIAAYVAGGAYRAATVEALQDRAEAARYKIAGAEEATIDQRHDAYLRLRAVLDLLRPAHRPLALTFSDLDGGMFQSSRTIEEATFRDALLARIPNPPAGYREPNPPRRWRA